MNDTQRICIPIREEPDVVIARSRARAYARREGLPENAADELALAISELARNIVVHAGHGEISLTPVEERGRRGIRVCASDRGPGIVDPALAMQDGHSTAGSLGLGLPSARRLCDELELVSEVGKGTTVTLTKWIR